MPTTITGGSFLTRRPARFFAPESFDGEALLMIEAAQEFSVREVLPIADRLQDQESGLMPALMRKAAEMGFCGIGAPDAFGGLGLSKKLGTRLAEFLSLEPSFSVTFGVSAGVGTLGIQLFGSPEQQSRYLPQLLQGQVIAAFALSEPNAGSDAMAVKTRAERVAGGWKLNGSKMWITNAKWAGLFTVIARAEDGLTAFIVERGDAGFVVEREEHKMGLKGSSTARLTLTDVFVPDERLLHVPGQGHHVALNALNLGRLKLAAMCLGSARQAIRLASRYAKERRQFGKPLAEIGPVRGLLAQMAMRFAVAESVTYAVADWVDLAFEREPGALATREFAAECAIAKVLASEAQGFIVDAALQIHGGYGFTEEFAIARLYRDSRVSRIYEGANEVNRSFIGRRMHPLLRAAQDPLDPECAAFAATDEPDDLACHAFGQYASLRLGEMALAARPLPPCVGDLAARWFASEKLLAQAVAAQAHEMPPMAPAIHEIAVAVLHREGPL